MHTPCTMERGSYGRLTALLPPSVFIWNGRLQTENRGSEPWPSLRRQKRKGGLAVSFHLEWAPSNGKPWLGTVAVAPEAKEKGIGRAVIEEIAGRLRGEHKAMFSAVPLDRQEWILFLSQCGFEQLKLEKDDREKTYMIMVKPL